MNYLDIFNIVARAARPAHSQLAPATDMADRLEDLGLDSLDGLMMMMYIGELFGIPDEVCKDFNPTTVQEVYDFVQQHKTQEPESLEAAMEAIK